MKKSYSAFISYSHKDKEKSSLLASYVSRLGINTWLDVKEISAGQVIIKEVSKAIEQADIYIICLSPNSIESPWVIHELNTALTLEATRKKPSVIPILFSPTDIPIVLSGRLYLDMTKSLDDIKLKLKETIRKCATQKGIGIEQEIHEDSTILSAVTFELHEDTVKIFGTNNFTEFSEEDVKEEAFEILKSLRKKANGILLYFINAEDMDFSSPIPKFPNGEYSQKMIDEQGPFDATLIKKAVVEVKVFNPSETKVMNLVSSKLKQLGVGKIIYEYFLSPPKTNFTKKVIKKIQANHVILGWDKETGAEIELPDELNLSVLATDEQIKISLETKYQFQFEKRLECFSVKEFIEWLMK